MDKRPAGADLGLTWYGANQFEIEILGEMYPANLVMAPLYDPNGLRMGE